MVFSAVRFTSAGQKLCHCYKLFYLPKSKSGEVLKHCFVSRGSPAFQALIHSFLRDSLLLPPTNPPRYHLTPSFLPPPQFTPLSRLPLSLPSPTPAVCHRESRRKVVAMIRKKITISWMFLFSALQLNASRTIYELLFCLCNEIQFFKS